MHLNFGLFLFAQLYVLTHIEGLQLWDFGAETRVVKVDDMRPSLSATSPGLEIDYCKHDFFLSNFFWLYTYMLYMSSRGCTHNVYMHVSMYI
jgi:hypothetical protein